MDLRPSEIYFSQNSVNNVFDKQCSHPYRPIGKTLDDLCEGRITIASIPKITVVKHNEKWTSEDNRRLWVFRQLERLGKCTTLNVNVGYSIPLGKLTSYNEGVSVLVRGSPGGSWHLKRDAPTSQTATDSQQRYGLEPITQHKTEAVKGTNDILTYSCEDNISLERLRLSSAPVPRHNAVQERSRLSSAAGQIYTAVQARQSPSSKKSAVFDSKLLVAAIDFGTTNSGYAFSFRSDFAKDPMKIVTNQWKTSDGRSVPFKAPTCVLFDELGRFDSFGFDAEDKYSRLVTENKQANWYFVKHFKMALYDNKDLNKHTQIKEVNGKQMMAITVVSECIKYLTTSLLETCNQATKTVRPADIHWVLTVPAIWNDGAKQFMRKAAIQAGILSESLTLALEPEAASLFCKYVNVDEDSDEASSLSTVSKYALDPGSKYVLLDAGGGTVDITVHEIQRNSKIKEIYKANGGPWGGTNVNEAFMEFLENIFDKEVMTYFQRNYNSDYLELVREFEWKKTLFDPQLQEDIKLKMPPSIYESYELVNGTQFRCSEFLKSNYQIKIVRDKLVVASHQVVAIFSPICEKIVAHLQEIFLQPAVKSVDTLVTVGGFSESKCLQREISRAFPGIKISSPDDPCLAVVKGAVIYGYDPNKIVSRISRFTYGISTSRPFVQGKSKESKKIIRRGELYCNDCFSVHVHAGQTVVTDGKNEEIEYHPERKTQASMTLRIYLSEAIHPEYIDDIAALSVKLL